MTLHMWLMGDSDTTRKKVCGAGFGRCSGAGPGLTGQEVIRSNPTLAPFTPSQLFGFIRHKLIAAWPAVALLYLNRVQVDM